MVKKTLLLFSAFALVTLLASFSSPKQKSVRTIILDAGHGGHDVGAKGEYSYEKDICLDIEAKIAEIIRREHPEIRLIRTRSSDDFVHVHRRADIANQNKGDLFISIHVNAAPPKQHRELTGYKTVTSYTGKGKKKKKVTRKVPQYRYYTTPNPAKGTETFIWGAHKNEDKEVALRENSPIFSEENYKEKYGDIDLNSPEFVALSLLKTKQFFKRSATLSGMVEDEFEKIGRISRGQKQRQVGIWVLQATAMPSILVETGYITNRSEEDYLNGEKGQKEIATCVTNALHQYIKWLEKQYPTETPVKGITKNSNPAAFLDAVEQHEKQRMSR